MNVACTLVGLVLPGLVASLPSQEPPATTESLRWRFGDPSDPEWKAARDRRLQQVDRWWLAFEAKASDIDALFERKQQWDLATWMQQNLQAIDSRLMWEFGPGLTDGHRLVITPEAARELRPFVDTLLERAPRLVPPGNGDDGRSAWLGPVEFDRHRGRRRCPSPGAAR